MTSIPSLLKSGVFCGAALVLAATSANAADTNYARYFKSSAALSAVASAISILEPCEKPIQFSEKTEDSTVKLKATCPATDGDAITVELSFQSDEAGNLFPDSFDYGN